jgi:hypothetical protein
MLPQILENTVLADLQKLVDRSVTESVRLDFKRDNYRLNSKSPEDKKNQCKELLKDTSALANAHGGDLILGIGEDKGAAASLVGIQIDSADALKRQIIAIMLNGISPKIAFSIHTVHVKDDYHAFIIRVRPSIHAPHRVVYRGEQGKFWMRDSGGAHEMDAEEIADISRRSESLSQSIEGFRKDRVEVIQRNECPIPLITPQRLVIHLIPEEAFMDFEIKAQDLSYHHASMMPILHRTDGWTHEHNLSGLVTYDRALPNLPTSGYVQLFTNGILEAVADDVTYFTPMDTEKRHLFFKDYRREIPQPLHTYLRLMTEIGVSAPVWLFVSFLGLTGVEVYPQDILGRIGHPIRENMILAPGQVIEDFDTDIKSLIKMAFDRLWNAAGYEGCRD